MMLADQEPRSSRLKTRPAATPSSAANRQGDMSALYLNNNRNKKSVALNLKEQQAEMHFGWWQRPMSLCRTSDRES